MSKTKPLTIGRKLVSWGDQQVNDTCRLVGFADILPLTRHFTEHVFAFTPHAGLFEMG